MHLHDHHGCELQIGGSDQWGNILSGVDLIRRATGTTVHALCWPLLTAPDGTKLGKTTGARVWLSAERTSPFELYQHFLQIDDRQVRQYLCWFTLLPVAEIDARGRRARGRARAARRPSAASPVEVTALVHGPAEAAAAAEGTAALDRRPLGAAALPAREGAVPDDPTSTGVRRPRPGRPAGQDRPGGLEERRPPAGPAGRRAGQRRAGGDPEPRCSATADFVEGRWSCSQSGNGTATCWSSAESS